MIQVTKPFLPNSQKLERYLSGIHERGYLTNNGPLVRELTTRLEEYLNTTNLLLVCNGTIALQVAYKALGITPFENCQQKEVLTTPFTFIATSSSISWEGYKVIFSDIDSQTWCIDPNVLEDKITNTTQAIVPVHVFGNACDVDRVEQISAKFGIKTIYDACHAFGTKVKGKSVLDYGDASTLSFHATKLFHTVEGGAIRFASKDDLEHAQSLINFGISNGTGDILNVGINGKLSEVHAAYGLCILDEIDFILEKKHEIFDRYFRRLSRSFQFQKISDSVSFNASYVPVVCETERQAINILQRLKQQGVVARRYFYPSLTQVECLDNATNCPKAEKIASRIICLPSFVDLELSKIDEIANIVVGL